MALSSTSTPAEVEAAYIDNVVAADTYDPTAASVCLHALRIFRIRNPQGGTFGGRSFTMTALDAEVQRFVEVLDATRFSSSALTGRSRRVGQRPDGSGGYL